MSLPSWIVAKRAIVPSKVANQKQLAYFSFATHYSRWPQHYEKGLKLTYTFCLSNLCAAFSLTTIFNLLIEIHLEEYWKIDRIVCCQIWSRLVSTFGFAGDCCQPKLQVHTSLFNNFNFNLLSVIMLTDFSFLQMVKNGILSHTISLG